MQSTVDGGGIGGGGGEREQGVLRGRLVRKDEDVECRVRRGGELGKGIFLHLLSRALSSRAKLELDPLYQTPNMVQTQFRIYPSRAACEPILSQPSRTVEPFGSFTGLAVG